MFERSGAVEHGGARGAADVLDEPDWLPRLTVTELHGKAPGADLAVVLEMARNADADDAGLVEAVAAWQRMAAWAAAGAARAAAALAEREAMNPDWPASAGDVSERNVAGEELAMRLGCSRRAARTLVRHGRAFDRALAPTGDALWRGEIDPARARVLVEALDRPEVPGTLAWDVQLRVLPDARGWTAAELSRQVARALLVADPAGAVTRRGTARAGRRLDRPRFLPDGMAGVWAVLDAADAVRLDARIDDLARCARDNGDPRTLDQLRADVLVELGLAATTAVTAEDHHGRRPGAPGDAAAARGRREAGGLGAGGLGAGGLRAGGLRAGGLGVEDRGRRSGASGAAAVARGGVEGELEAEAARGSTASRAGCRCGTRTAPRSQVRVTVPLTTLAGLDDTPGDLAGYGPVSAYTARLLAAGGTWRRLVTDPLSGAVLDVGRTRYRPPAELGEHVRSRDRVCARPGCATSADRCDLDHTVGYRDGGTTSAPNLGPLCPRDHQVKTDGGFTLSQPQPGRFRWTTPTGHVYEAVPGTGSPRTHAPPRAPSRPPGWWDVGDAPPF